MVSSVRPRNSKRSFFPMFIACLFSRFVLYELVMLHSAVSLIQHNPRENICGSSFVDIYTGLIIHRLPGVQRHPSSTYTRGARLRRAGLFIILREVSR